MRAEETWCKSSDAGSTTNDDVEKKHETCITQQNYYVYRYVYVYVSVQFRVNVGVNEFDNVNGNVMANIIIEEAKTSYKTISYST